MELCGKTNEKKIMIIIRNKYLSKYNMLCWKLISAEEKIFTNPIQKARRYCDE